VNLPSWRQFIIFYGSSRAVSFGQVSDVSALAGLSSLQTLNLDGTCVTEGSLEHLATHPGLMSLSLAGIPVADGDHVLQIISGT